MTRFQSTNVPAVILLLAFFVGPFAKAEEIRSFSSEPFFVELGEEFEIREGQRVGMTGTGFEVEILRFFNQPCPPNVKCVWSGIGVEFQYWNDGQSVRGINLVKAFGYKTTVIKSDYESYAVLKITQDFD